MKKFIALILALALCMSLTACLDLKAKPYEEAVALMDAGEYQAAAEAFEALEDYEDAPEKALDCHYELALASYEKEEFDAAQEAFEKLSGHKDSAEMAEKCRREIGMRENADYDFLRDMETMNNAKIYCEPFDWFTEYGHGNYESFMAELDLLEKYVEASFYDQELHELAKMYVDGIMKQKSSLSASDADTIRSREVEGSYLKYTVLVRLYEEYDFMKDNEVYGIFRYPEHQKVADACGAYPAVYEDLVAQLDAANIYTSVDESSDVLSLTIVNNTAHAYSGEVYLLPMDVRGAQIDMPTGLLIENLAPGASIELSATIENADSFWSYEYDVFFTDIDGMSPYFWY